MIGVSRGRDETPRPNRHPRSKSVSFVPDRDVAPNSPDDRRRRRRRRDRDRDSHSDASASDSEGHDRHHRRQGTDRRERDRDRRHREPSPTQSDSTVDLPDRFDKHGKKKLEEGKSGGDPITDKIEQILSGQGTAGKLFKNITENFLGGGDKKR